MSKNSQNRRLHSLVRSFVFLSIAVCFLLRGRLANAQYCDLDPSQCGPSTTNQCGPGLPPQWCACENDPASCLGGGAGVSNGGNSGGPNGSSGGWSPPYTPSRPAVPQGPSKSIIQQKCPAGANDTMVGHFVSLGLKGGFDGDRNVFGQRLNFIAGAGLPTGRGLERSRSAAAVKDTDPVAPNGEFVIDTTDVTLPGYGIPFTFTRHYRSAVMYSTSLGYGWNHDFARRIVSLRTTPTAATPSRCTNRPREVAYVDARMNRTHFVFASSDGTVDTYQPMAGEDLRLTLDHGTNQWVLIGDGDLVSRFDAGYGTLASVSDYAGHVLKVAWDHSSHPEWAEVGGVVTSVTDTTGRVVHFNYASSTANWTSMYKDVTAKASGVVLQCLSTASDCSSTPPLVTFDTIPILAADSTLDESPVTGLLRLEVNLVGVHGADGTSVFYTYDDHENAQGSLPGERYHHIHSAVAQNGDADPLCHELCDADNAACSTVDACQRAIDEMQTYMCDPIHLGPTGFTVKRDPNQGTTVTGPSVDYPNPGTGCYEFCMSGLYTGGTAALYQQDQAACVGYAENLTIGADGRSYDFCAIQYKPACVRQLDVLQANISSCRSACFSNCKAAFGGNSTSYFDGLGSTHRILRVTDGEGRIVVDNEYSDNPAEFNYGRIRWHAQGAALPGTPATTMSFATLDFDSPAARQPTFCGPADASLVAHVEQVVDTSGVTHTRNYDASWRILDDLNNASQAKTTYVYAGDHLRGVQDPSGAITCIDVDGMGKPTQITRTPAPGYHAKPAPVVTKLTWDSVEQLVELVDDATGGAPRGVHYTRDGAERVIAEAHQVGAFNAQWTCYGYDDTLLGSSGGGMKVGAFSVRPPILGPGGSSVLPARANSTVGAVAVGLATALVKPLRSGGGGGGGGGGGCPSWGCTVPMFKPSGCALALTPSPHATDASYLRAVTPSTVTRPDGSLVIGSDITVGGPSDVVVMDNDGATPLVESYVDYDAFGRPAANGRVVGGARVAGSGATTTYDATTGHLLKVVRDPANGGAAATTSYHYDKSGQLHQIEAPSFVRTIDVDALGHVVGVSEAPANGYTADARRTCFNIDVQGRLHDVIHPEGDAIHHDYDAGGTHVVAVSRGALGSYGAWANGCVQLTPKAMETFAAYSWDAKSGFPTSRVVDQREIDYAVDGFGRIVDEVQFGHAVTVIVPNGPGGITTATILVNRHRWRSYNAFDELALDTSYDVVVDKKTPPPDFSLPSAPTPGMHFLVQHGYDGLGRHTSTTAWRFTEQPDNGLTQLTPTSDSAGDAYTTVSYDDVGDTVTTSDQDGHILIESFDPLGRPRHRSTAAGDASAIDQSYTWQSAKDSGALDSVVETRSPAPTSTGMLVRKATFDAHGLLRSIVEADRTVAKLDYDDADRMAHRTTPFAGTETFDVDAYGRLVTTHRPVGGLDASSTRHWDRDDRVGSIVDGDTHATSYAYDAQGRLASETTPLGTTVRTYVPGRDALQTVALLNGSTISYGYGPSNVVAPPGDGRLWSRSVYRGNTTEREEDYRYSDVGLLASVQLGAGGSMFTRSYDSIGRVVSETAPGGGITVRRSYAPNAEQIVLDTGKATATIARTFDAHGRVAGVSFNGGSIAGFDYANGALGAIHYGNGVTQSLSYDDRLRPLATTVTKSGTLASSSTIYGADDVPRVRTRTLGTFTATDLFQADSISRVIGEDLAIAGTPSFGGTSTGNIRDLTNEDVQAAWSTSMPNSTFTLDGASNWSARQGTNAFTPTIDGLNRYTAIDADTVGYDALGNLSTYRDESYSVNSDGMLTSATKSGLTMSYGYDGFGRRWFEQSGGHYTYYVWDGDAIVATVPDGDPTRAQLRIGAGSDDTLALADAFGANPLHYVHAGTDGSALAVTDPYGVLIEGYAYSAYGDTTVLDTSGRPLGASRVNNRFLFQGQLYDAQLGTYSMRAREYKPAWGRFLSGDPAGLSFADNRYAFVDGRPLTMRDPTGLCGQTLLHDPHFGAFRDWADRYDEQTSLLGKFNAAGWAAMALLDGETARELARVAGWLGRGVQVVDPDGSKGFALAMSAQESSIRQISVAGGAAAAIETGLLDAAADAERVAPITEEAQLVAARRDLTSLLHRRGLGLDPDVMRYRPNEARAAGELEEMLGSRLERAAKGSGADWVDSGKMTYDLVGPVPAQYFNVRSFTSQIIQHLAKVDRPVLDLRGLGAAQIADVDKFISGLATYDQRRLIIFR